MTQIYTLNGKVCHIACEYAGGRVSVRWGTPLAWQGECTVGMRELEVTNAGPLNGAEGVCPDGSVTLFCWGTDYRVTECDRVQVAEYHDDGSVNGWTSCHGLTLDERVCLVIRAEKVRRAKLSRESGPCAQATAPSPESRPTSQKLTTRGVGHEAPK